MSLTRFFPGFFLKKILPNNILWHRVQKISLCNTLQIDKLCLSATQIDEEYALLKREEIEQCKAQQEGKIKIDCNENISTITGVPEEHIKNRRVRIAMVPKSALQSGTDNTHVWRIEFDTRESWENALMGWSSSGDPLSSTTVFFATKEDAVRFCKKNDWEWFSEKKKSRLIKVKSYGSNFAYMKRTRISTK